MFIYFWDRERQSMSRGGAEREGDTKSKTGSRFWAVSTEPNAGLELTECETMTWAEVRRSTDRAIQSPQFTYFWKRERERERVSAQREEGQKERETQNLKQAPGSELSARSLTRSSNLQTARSWPELKLHPQPTEPPRRPSKLLGYY